MGISKHSLGLPFRNSSNTMLAARENKSISKRKGTHGNFLDDLAGNNDIKIAFIVAIYIV